MIHLIQIQQIREGVPCHLYFDIEFLFEHNKHLGQEGNEIDNAPIESMEDWPFWDEEDRLELYPPVLEEGGDPTALGGQLIEEPELKEMEKEQNEKENENENEKNEKEKEKEKGNEEFDTALMLQNAEKMMDAFKKMVMEELNIYYELAGDSACRLEHFIDLTSTDDKKFSRHLIVRLPDTAFKGSTR